MAAVDTQTSANSNGAVASTTVAHTCSGSDRLLLVSVTQDRRTNDPTVTGITYNGVAMSLVNDGSTEFACRSSLWSLVAPDSGASYDVVVTYSSSLSQNRVICILSLTGVDQGTPADTVTRYETSTNAAAFSNTYTNGATNDLTVDFLGLVSTSSSTGLTPDGTQTSRLAVTNGAVSAGVSTDPGAASATMGWTWTTNAGTIRQHIIAVNPSAGSSDPLSDEMGMMPFLVPSNTDPRFW